MGRAGAAACSQADRSGLRGCACASCGISLAWIMSCTDSWESKRLSGCCRNVAAAGMGCAVLPAFNAERDGQQRSARQPCPAHQTLTLTSFFACTTGEHLPPHVAVVRDAFGAHDDSHRRLAQEVAALGPHKVHAALIYQRVVVSFGTWRSPLAVAVHLQHVLQHSARLPGLPQSLVPRPFHTRPCLLHPGCRCYFSSWRSPLTWRTVHNCPIVNQ